MVADLRTMMFGMRNSIPNMFRDASSPSSSDEALNRLSRLSVINPSRAISPAPSITMTTSISNDSAFIDSFLGQYRNGRHQGELLTSMENVTNSSIQRIGSVSGHKPSDSEAQQQSSLISGPMSLAPRHPPTQALPSLPVRSSQVTPEETVSRSGIPSLSHHRTTSNSERAPSRSSSSSVAPQRQSSYHQSHGHRYSMRKGVKSILKPSRPLKSVRFDVSETVSQEELRLANRALLQSPPAPEATSNNPAHVQLRAMKEEEWTTPQSNLVLLPSQIVHVKQDHIDEHIDMKKRSRARMSMMPAPRVPTLVKPTADAKSGEVTISGTQAHCQAQAESKLPSRRPRTVSEIPTLSPTKKAGDRRVTAPASGLLRPAVERGPSPLGRKSPSPRPRIAVSSVNANAVTLPLSTHTAVNVTQLGQGSGSGSGLTVTGVMLQPSASINSTSSSLIAPTRTFGEPRRNSGYPARVRRVPAPKTSPIKSTFDSIPQKRGTSNTLPAFAPAPMHANTSTTHRPISTFSSASSFNFDNIPASSPKSSIRRTHIHISPPKRLQPLTRSKPCTASSRQAQKENNKDKENAPAGKSGVMGVSSFNRVLSAIPKARLLASKHRGTKTKAGEATS
jgi:hypothetical protein